MDRGAKAALLISCATLAGCSTAEPVKVRAIADPSAALAHGDALAVARGQFMLGNVGLALEGFRKAQREDPYNPAVMSGIGDCYAAMGRFDIAEQSYEVALSLAPRDHELLLGLASVLERGGDFKRAKDIRDEAARFEQAKALLAAQATARAKALATAQPPVQQRSAQASVTVALPAARPATVAAAASPPTVTALKVAAALPVEPIPAKVPKPVPEATPKVPPAHDVVPAEPQKAPPPAVVLAVTAPSPVAPAAKPVPSAPPAPPVSVAPVVPLRTASAAAVPVAPAASAGVAAVPVVPSVPTVAAAATPARVVAAAVPLKAAVAAVAAPTAQAAPSAPRLLPAVLRADQRAASPITTAQPVASSAKPSKSSPPVEVAFRAPEPAGPRLQRLSNGEVALLTTKDASWKPTAASSVVSQLKPPVPEAPRSGASVETAAAGTVHWVPLRFSRASASVQVLNAARSDGLAGSARSVLYGRGWRSVAIGNAGSIRRTSVVFYPKERAKLGRRLAAQFGVRAKLAETEAVVLVLGRDSIGRIARQRIS